MALAVELQLDAVVDDALAVQPLAGADRRAAGRRCPARGRPPGCAARQYSRLRLSSTTDSIPRALAGAAPASARPGRRRRSRPGSSGASRPASRTAPPGPGPRRRTAWPGRSGRRGGAARARSETTSRAPLMPSGWPSAIAPPLTFTRSGSSPSSRTTATLCEANASFSSTRSISSIATPVRSSSLRTAGIGPMPITRGSTPAAALPAKRRQRLGAQRRRPLLARDHERGRAVVHAARVARGDAAAGAKRGLERGQPLGGRVRPRVLVAVERRRPGRARRRSGRPPARPPSARCERSANASWSARETPYRSATFSPVSPMLSSGNIASRRGLG